MIDKKYGVVLIRLLDRELNEMKENTQWIDENLKNMCIHTIQNCKREVFKNSELMEEALKEQMEQIRQEASRYTW